VKREEGFRLCRRFAMGDVRHVTGKELRDLFDRLNPFTDDLCLKPEDERKTVLALNGNFPFGLELLGFYHAAAQAGGSPVIVQFSLGSLITAGRGLKSGGSRLDALRNGARLARLTAEAYASMYEPPFAALGLDHYSVPGVEEALASGEKHVGDEDVPSRARIRSMLEQAAEAAISSGVKPPSRGEMSAWEAYLASAPYREAVAGFRAALEEMRPAWAMIDTEDLPPVLNFAVTREFSGLLGEIGSDAILEAEYGATGRSGDGEEYLKLRGKELEAFAREVAGFVRYTGAGGISYPIGMEHAAPSDVKHEPDTERLETVQRRIIEEAGRYTPFAQHGGTGAKRVARGLVAKDNVNTLFLVTAARALKRHIETHREGIDRGEKAASGVDMYLDAARAISEAVLEKLRECGTYGFFGLSLDRAA